MDGNTCSMIGCDNSAGTEFHQFYSFPTNFDLCMLWVQNCGRAELFEDFAYGGAQPFINRVICSDHFNNSDFNDSSCINKGLKPQAVPRLNCDESDLVVVKQEYGDLANNTHVPEINELVQPGARLNSIIKLECFESNLYSTNSSSDFGESEGGSSHDELEHENLLDEPFLPLFVVPKDSDVSQYEKSQKAFRTAWKRTLESVEQREARIRGNLVRNAFRRANETEEQRKARNEANALRNASRRANENEDERKDRLYKNAVRAALRRSMESEGEQKERKRKNALRAAFRRSVESEGQRSERRLKDKVRSAERRRKETDLQSKIRRYNDAVRAAFRRSNESDEQRRQRRIYDVMRAARRRNNENSEQRMKRLQADRDRAAKRRMLKKLSLDMSYIQNTFFNHDLEPYLNHDVDSSTSGGKGIPELEENSSNDELSNQSGCTYNKCDSLGNINASEISANSFKNVHNSANSNNETSCSSDTKVAALPSHNVNNSRTEINDSATGATPEVVWCT